MNQPGTRITVDAAMRARDVSRPGQEAVQEVDQEQPEEAPRPRKGERRRLSKRAGYGNGGSSPVSS